MIKESHSRSVKAQTLMMQHRQTRDIWLAMTDIEIITSKVMSFAKIHLLKCYRKFL